MSDFKVVLPATTEEWQRDMTIAYEQGRADQKEDDNAFFNFEGVWELEKKKVRAEVIDACKSLIMETVDNDLLVGTLVLRLYKLKEELSNVQEELL